MPATLGTGLLLQGAEEPPDWCGRLQLLVLQASPFCNLDCDYCYLPTRGDRRRMDVATLDAIAAKVFSARLPAPSLSIVWHSGEPLAVPREWYADAFERLGRQCPDSVCLTHHFQTNGVLIDRRWASFIREHGVRIGVSLDGPAWLHDRHRLTRDGRGTHARTMQGISALRDAGVPFHLICVLTLDSLSHADAIFDCFAELGPTQVCFNIEEVEAANLRSTLSTDSIASERLFRIFMTRIVERLRKNPDVFRVREVDAILAALRSPVFGRMQGNSQNQPGEILNVAWDGRFSTFSPELLGESAPEIGDLSLGNILDDPLPPARLDHRYLHQWHAIESGVKECRNTCKYFDFCLGGAPSNKLAETGRLEATETLYCRLTQKAVTDVVLGVLEHELQGLQKPKDGVHPRSFIGEIAQASRHASWKAHDAIDVHPSQRAGKLP